MGQITVPLSSIEAHSKAALVKHGASDWIAAEVAKAALSLASYKLPLKTKFIIKDTIE